MNMYNSKRNENPISRTFLAFGHGHGFHAFSNTKRQIRERTCFGITKLLISVIDNGIRKLQSFRLYTMQTISWPLYLQRKTKFKMWRTK